MKNFKEFIQEARRNPDKNPKIYAYDALEKYSENPNVFVSFVKSTEDFEENSKNPDAHKIGINPKSEFDTPNGIYSYPLNIIWDSVKDEEKKTFNFPYATGHPYIYAFELNGNIIDFAQYGVSEYKTHSKQLDKLFFDLTSKFGISSEIANDMLLVLRFKAHSTANQKKVPSFFMNITRIMSLLFETTSIKKIDRGVYDFILKKQNKIRFNINNNILTFEYDKIVSNPNKWNWIFRQLGIDGLLDSNGEGIIHENEPTQCVVFSKKVIKIVDVIRNTQIRRVKNTKQTEMTMSEIGELKTKIESGTLNWTDIPKHLVMMLLYQSNVDISKTDVDELESKLKKEDFRNVLKYNPNMLKKLITEEIQIPDDVLVDFLQMYYDIKDFMMVIENQNINQKLAKFIVVEKPTLFPVLYEKIKLDFSEENILKLIRIVFRLQYHFILENIKIDLTKIPDYDDMIEDTLQFRPNSIRAMKRHKLKIPEHLLKS